MIWKLHNRAIQMIGGVVYDTFSHFVLPNMIGILGVRCGILYMAPSFPQNPGCVRFKHRLRHLDFEAWLFKYSGISDVGISHGSVAAGNTKKQVSILEGCSIRSRRILISSVSITPRDYRFFVPNWYRYLNRVKPSQHQFFSYTRSECNVEDLAILELNLVGNHGTRSSFRRS
jgi:hypothetical protein